MLTLSLVPLPATLRGIYGATKDKLPTRFLWAHPDLANAIDATERDGLSLAYSDIFRSPEASLARRKEFDARGGPQLAKRPGESPHNFGLAVDIDVMWCLKTYRISKQALDERLQRYGLYCHRRDHQLAAESWHYNALGEDAAQWLQHASTSSTSRAIEAKILALNGEGFRLTPMEIERSLAKLGYKPEKGIRGAVMRFQDDWDLSVDGLPGPKTQRLLAYLTAVR